MEDEDDISIDCDEICPECMSRRVSTLDLLTREYECENCGFTWFAEDSRDYEPKTDDEDSADDSDEPPEPDPLGHDYREDIRR